MQNGKVLHLNERLSSGSEWRLTETSEGKRPELVPISCKSSAGEGGDNYSNEESGTINFNVGDKKKFEEETGKGGG